MAKIETISGKIVCTETEITITNEKLKNTLSDIYETARDDANKKKWYDYFTVGFSIAGTILLALLTATFNDIGSISSHTVTTIAWVIFGIIFSYGVVALIAKLISNNTRNEHKERDKAIIEAMGKIK